MKLKAIPLVLNEEQKQALEEGRKESQQEYDKLLVYLASGGLVLTVGFVKDLVHLEKAIDLWYLKATWCFFSISLFVALVSHLFSVWAIEAAQSDSVWWKLWNSVVKATNIVSLLTLLLGVGSFLYFTSHNIQSDMKNPQKGTQQGQAKPDKRDKGMSLSPLITRPNQPEKPTTPRLQADLKSSFNSFTNKRAVEG